MNSDPQVDEVIQSSANLVKELAGAAQTVGLAAAAGVEECTPLKTEESVECVVKLTCYEQLHACPTQATPCP